MGRVISKEVDIFFSNHHLIHLAHPASKSDLNALNEAVRKHKRESGSKPPPPPPPMPAQKPVLRKKSEENTPIQKDESTGIPKGIVASQIRRLSGDASLFPLRSSIPANESFPTHEKDLKSSTRQNDLTDNQIDKRQMTNSYASSTYSSSHQLTENNVQSSSQSYHRMGQSLASASFQNSYLNPNSLDNVRVSTGSVGTPGALPKHGRTFTTTGPNRGQGVLTQPSSGRVPICGSCASQVRLVMGVTSVVVCRFHVILI